MHRAPNDPRLPGLYYTRMSPINRPRKRRPVYKRYKGNDEKVSLSCLDFFNIADELPRCRKRREKGKNPLVFSGIDGTGEKIQPICEAHNAEKIEGA